MTGPRQTPLYRLIVEVRRAFRDLSEAGDRVMLPFDLTAAERAVLEQLAAGGAATVPAIARRMSVSRQHIQKLADSLVAKGLAEYRQNPAHKRSQLIGPTGEGLARCRDVRTAENAVIERIAPRLEGQDLDAARASILALRKALMQ